MNIVSPYPLWYVIFCVILGALMAFLLYRKDKKLAEFAKGLKIVLFSLRFICIAVLAALLLSPLVKYFNKEVEPPIIVIAHDNSASMVMGKDSTMVKEVVKSKMSALVKELEKDYEVEQFEFSEKLETLNDRYNFKGKFTNFDLLFDDLASRYANRNVGGLVLVSDGIYNQGNNPSYRVNTLDFPIFPIPVGDTTRYIDAKIQRLRSNKLAFLGNKFPVEFDVRLQEVEAESIKVHILKEGKAVFTEQLAPSRKNETLTVTTLLEADEVGKQRYEVYVETLKGESNEHNNSKRFYIDVLDGRQKIAILGMAPHPDLSVLKRVISSNENYEVKSGLLADISINPKDFDLIILHQSNRSKSASITPEIRTILESTTPLFLIGGGWDNAEKTLQLPFNQSQKVVKNEAQGIVNQQFSLFIMEEKFMEQLVEFPPMSVSMNQTVGNANQTLLYQKLGSVFTKFPLLSFFTNSNRKIGRLYGEGLWRWSMMSYVLNKSHQNFHQFIGKIIQFLAVKENRSLFRITADDEIFENEAVNINAQLFNPSYELVNDKELELKLTNEEGKVFDYIFSRTENDYQLKLSSLPPGDYAYVSSINHQGKQHLASGSFVVKKIQLEQFTTEANHQLMYELGAKSGGELIPPSQLENLVERFRARSDINTVFYVKEEIEEVINLKWIFYLLIGLLSLEWFIRKWGGAY